MTSRMIIFTCILLAIGVVGCGWNRPFEGRAGTLDQQRFNASIHDPYSDNDAGPEVVGGRPREFTKPRSEPTRSRGWSNWFLGQ